MWGPGANGTANLRHRQDRRAKQDRGHPAARGHLPASAAGYKNLLPSSHPAYSRIGIHNDAVFGKIPNKGYGTGGLDAGSAQWNQLVTQAPYAPQDGELYYSTWNQTNNVYCDGLRGDPAVF